MPNDSKIYGFDKQDAQRISNIVPYAEGLKRQGVSRPVNLTNKINATVYAELLSEPGDAPGFWSAREVVYSDVSWGLGGTGKQFNGTDFPYLRHYNWDTAEKGQVVKAFLVVDTSNGLQEWVFDTDITNPESFVFYGEDNGGVGQARAGGLWKMKKGGSVLTNVGTVEIPDIIAQAFPMTDNQKCYIEIKFGDLGYGFELKEVNIRIDATFGQYWEEKPDGELIVKWPIAELVKEGDIVKLKQFWSGDIHLEIFGTATDEDDDDYDDDDPYDRSKTRPTVVIGDNKWIIVNKFGNTYQVTHQLPNPEQPRDSFKCFNNLLDCNPVNFASFSDVSAWVNALLAKINEFKFDTRGHIYQRLDCDGNILDDYGDDITEEYELLTSTLTSNLVGSDIRPEDVGGAGITCDYKIFNQGNNFTDWIGVKTVIVGVTNGNGQAMFFDIFNIADIGMKSSYSELASNNAGTSGFNDPLFFGTRNFRFNDTLTLQVSVVGKGLLQVKQHSTASVSVTHTLSATTFRDMNEDGATAISFNASYSIGSLGTVSSPDIWDGTSDIGPYLCEFNVLAPDGTQAQYALGENTQANLKNGPTYLELDNTSATGTFDLWIQVNQGASDDPVEDFIYGPGDTYQLCTKLRQVREWTEANVNSCDLLSYSSESDCVIDESGRQATDGSNDCIESACKNYDDGGGWSSWTLENFIEESATTVLTGTSVGNPSPGLNVQAQITSAPYGHAAFLSVGWNATNKNQLTSYTYDTDLATKTTTASSNLGTYIGIKQGGKFFIGPGLDGDSTWTTVSGSNSDISTYPEMIWNGSIITTDAGSNPDVTGYYEIGLVVAAYASTAANAGKTHDAYFDNYDITICNT